MSSSGGDGGSKGGAAMSEFTNGLFDMEHPRCFGTVRVTPGRGRSLLHGASPEIGPSGQSSSRVGVEKLDRLGGFGGINGLDLVFESLGFLVALLLVFLFERLWMVS